jgi:hypothetical protein
VLFFVSRPQPINTRIMKTKVIILLFAAVSGISLTACRQSGDKKGTAEVPVLSESERSVYLEKGKTIAGATFAVLSSQLQSAMQEGGVGSAIEYCQVNAYPLVDSLSKVHNAAIRRTTLKVRNPDDQPTELEREILEAYARKDAAGEQIGPMVRALKGQEVIFFAPIRTNAFCLQCHGVPGQTLSEENYALIRRHYPEDQAIGYQDGDLRGMWSIRFSGER